MPNKQTTVLILLLIFLAASLYWLVWPAWGDSMRAKADLASWTVKLADAERTEKEITSLAEKYNNSEEAAKLLMALPGDENKEELLVQLEKMASENGLILNSVDFQDKSNQAGGLAANPPSAAVSTAGNLIPAGLAVSGLSIKLNGDVAALRNFLAAIENNLRIMEARTIDFKISKAESAAEQGVNFAIKINTYHRSD